MQDFDKALLQPGLTNLRNYRSQRSSMSEWLPNLLMMRHRSIHIELSQNWIVWWTKKKSSSPMMQAVLATRRHLLDSDRTAVLYRLGQDYPVRVWSRFGHGRQTRGTRKLCINVWGDAAIGFTGMDFETAVRENIPILSILFNNFSMAINCQSCLYRQKHRSTEISGHYADMAKAFGVTVSGLLTRTKSLRRWNLSKPHVTASGIVGIHNRPRNNYFQRIINNKN